MWPNAGLKGYLSGDLSTPAHFEQAVENVTEDDVAELVVCGPDVTRHVEKIREYADAGYDHVYIHQVGRDQDGVFGFCERELFPALRSDGLLA